LRTGHDLDHGGQLERLAEEVEVIDALQARGVMLADLAADDDGGALVAPGPAPR
jgi:hypothetical protein